MSKKPMKRGFKLWCVLDILTFTYKVQLYHGARKRTPITLIYIAVLQLDLHLKHFQNMKPIKEDEKLDQQ